MLLTVNLAHSKAKHGKKFTDGGLIRDYIITAAERSAQKKPID